MHHKEKELSLTVHGDDFTSTGTEKALAWLDCEFKKVFEGKSEVLGPDIQQQKEIRVLNRILSWTPEGVVYEADPRHAERVVAELGLENGRPVTTPGCREDVAKAARDGEDSPLLRGAESTSFRAVCATLNSLS